MKELTHEVLHSPIPVTGISQRELKGALWRSVLGLGEGFGISQRELKDNPSVRLDTRAIRCVETENLTKRIERKAKEIVDAYAEKMNLGISQRELKAKLG